MSRMGQTPRFDDVRVTSAFSLIATGKQTSEACFKRAQKGAFCSSVLVPALWSHGHGRREKSRFGFPGA
jgi:hypothetical protein